MLHMMNRRRRHRHARHPRRGRGAGTPLLVSSDGEETPPASNNNGGGNIGHLFSPIVAPPTAGRGPSLRPEADPETPISPLWLPSPAGPTAQLGESPETAFFRHNWMPPPRGLADEFEAISSELDAHAAAVGMMDGSFQPSLWEGTNNTAEETLSVSLLTSPSFFDTSGIFSSESNNGGSPEERMEHLLLDVKYHSEQLFANASYLLDSDLAARRGDWGVPVDTCGFARAHARSLSATLRALSEILQARFDDERGRSF